MCAILKRIVLITAISIEAISFANVTDQPFTNLEKALEQPDKVSVLHLSERQRVQDIARIHELSSVKRLVLESVAAEQGILDNKGIVPLEIFGLLSSSASRLPLALGSCTNLRILVVRDTPVIISSADIVNLSKLELLVVSQCGLREFPRGMSQLPMLRDVNLSYNTLEAVPIDMFDAPSLVTVNLSNNRLQNLPAQISLAQNLQGLALSDNALSSFPPEIGDLSRLEVLNVTGNHVTHLPDSIGGLGSLRVLNARDNRIVKIPETIGHLKNLQYLYLDNNELQDLPQEIGEIKSLRTLALSGNNLDSLPASISKLTRLRILDISDNPISELPLALGELTSLRKLIVSSGVSVAEQERIKLQLPKCEIEISNQDQRLSDRENRN